MLATLRKRHEREDEGFTLIELMVVVLIIAILLAIAIPTFLGARERANNRAAQSSLRNALTAAKTIYTDDQDYSAADTSAELLLVEPSLTYDDETVQSTGFKHVSVQSTDGADADALHENWAAAALSKSGTCYWIKESTSGTTFGSSTAVGGCDGADALAAAGTEFP